MNQADIYNAPFIFRSGHISTVYPSLFRNPINVPFERERISTSDDDFLDIDRLNNGSSRVAILCHGLEGSSSSKYILGSSSILSSQQWDVIAINYRGCSGTMNRQLRMYHSGATDDLDDVINHYKSFYEEIHLVGFSLGGNLVLKYAGERELSKQFVSLVAVSAPTDLRAGSLALLNRSNWIYTVNFLKSLKEKVRLKHVQYPNLVPIEKLKDVKNLYDFDDVFTGPMHGFQNADDYYAQCSSEQFLDNIKLNSLIINALDDPIVPSSHYPFELIAKLKNIELVTPKFGGHVGFLQKKEKYSWAEEMISKFLNKNSEVPA